MIDADIMIGSKMALNVARWIATPRLLSAYGTGVNETLDRCEQGLELGARGVGMLLLYIEQPYFMLTSPICCNCATLKIGPKGV